MVKSLKSFFETIMTATVGSEQTIIESETVKYIIVK